MPFTVNAQVVKPPAPAPAGAVLVADAEVVKGAISVGFVDSQQVAVAKLWGVNSKELDFFYLDAEPVKEGTYSGFSAFGEFTIDVAMTLPITNWDEAKPNAEQAAFVKNKEFRAYPLVGTIRADNQEVLIGGLVVSTTEAGKRTNILLVASVHEGPELALAAARQAAQGADPAACAALRKACEDDYTDNVAGCKVALAVCLGGLGLLCIIGIGQTAWLCACCAIGCPLLKWVLITCGKALASCLAGATLCVAGAAGIRLSCLNRANNSPACAGIATP
jgi:hypothetical protein